MNEAIKKKIKSEVKLLKECIVSLEFEIGKHNKEIQKMEYEIKSYKVELKRLKYGLSKIDRKELGFDN